VPVPGAGSQVVAAPALRFQFLPVKQQGLVPRELPLGQRQVARGRRVGQVAEVVHVSEVVMARPQMAHAER
jgi:hypothetical protein